MKAIVGEEVLQLPPFPKRRNVEEFVSSIERKVEEFSQRNEHRLLLVFQTGRSQAEVASAAVEADINGNIASDGIFSVHADNVRWNRMPRFLISLLKIPHPKHLICFLASGKRKKSEVFEDTSQKKSPFFIQNLNLLIFRECVIPIL